MKTTKGASKGITFQFQGLAGLLVDTSRTEARKIRAFIRILDQNDLLAVSIPSIPLQRSPTEDASSSNLVRHVAVWEENSITVHSTSQSLRLHILLKFPSGSTLSVGQCDWTTSSSENLQVRAFRWEEAAVRMDTEGDAALRLRVTHSRTTSTFETPSADSLGSLDYSFSQSETMLDTTDLVGFAVAMESGDKGVTKSRPTLLHKPKDRLVKTNQNDRFLTTNMAPSMAMDPLAIRRLFRARPEPVVVNEPSPKDEESSVKSKGSVSITIVEAENDEESHAQPKLASITVSKDHLDYLARNKTKVLGPSAFESSHEDEEAPPVRSVTPTPLLPPVESIEFEKQEKVEVVVPVVTPEKAVLNQATPPPKKKSSKRLFHPKKKKKDKRLKKSLLALEDHDESKKYDISPVPKRFAKIKSFFKRPWTSEKLYYEEGDAVPHKASQGREPKVDATEMNYALLSASSCKPPPEDESTELNCSVGEARTESLLQVRDQNVTPVDEFYSSALMENYFSGKPCVDSAAHITPETVTTVATTPERAVKALLHQPFLGEETPVAPNVQNSKDNGEIHSLVCADRSPIQIGDDGDGDNLSAIPEKSSPTSSSSNNWSNGTPVHAAPERKNGDPANSANRRTIGASTSFDADIHGTPVSKDLMPEESKQGNVPATSRLCTEKNDWETFDGNFAAEQQWLASTFNSSDSAFSEVSLRWRQKHDHGETQQPMWESLLIPPVEDTMNGHVHGERIQIQLKAPSQDMSQSYDSHPASTDPVAQCTGESILGDKINLQTSSDESHTLFFSRADDRAIKSKQSDDGEQWIVFDDEVRMGGASASHGSNNDGDVVLFNEDMDVHGIGSLVDWNVGEVFDPTEAFEHAVQDLDTVSDKGNDVIVTTTQMNLDYSILSEELMMDLLPSKNATPERTVDASPGRIAFLLSKSPKTSFPLATRPAESTDTEKEMTEMLSWQKSKTKTKTFARRLKDGLLGILVCGSHVKVLSTDDDDERESDDDSHSYKDSYPIWSQSPKRNSAKVAARKKGVHSSSRKKRVVHKKPSNNKKESIPPSHFGKQRDYRMHKTFSDGGSPSIRDRVLSPALSDAEDLAWAKASASRHWV
jgi:hypothetical protein